MGFNKSSLTSFLWLWDISIQKGILGQARFIIFYQVTFFTHSYQLRYDAGYRELWKESILSIMALRGCILPFTCDITHLMEKITTWTEIFWKQEALTCISLQFVVIRLWLLPSEIKSRMKKNLDLWVSFWVKTNVKLCEQMLI